LALNAKGVYMDSILNTIKLALGVEADYNGFDTNILLDINSALSNLNQLGVGSTEGFVVIDENDSWTDFLGNSIQLESVKSYILDKVRLSFDPPSNSFLVEAIQKQIQELEWRLMVQVDPPCAIDNLAEVTVGLSKVFSINIVEEVV
jgi:hypothetical protein